jgi:cytochrome bd-type quinol oxidase subunit 2
MVLASATREGAVPTPMIRALALAIGLLAFGGWVFVLAKPDLRASITSQPMSWWIPQAIVLAQAILCLVLVAGRNARGPLLVLTAAALAVGLLMWVQGMKTSGRHPFPFTPALNALLLWRLVRKQEIAAKVAA